MGNWINFDNLPRNKNGSISWKDCNNNIVEFNYNGLQSSFIIVKRLQIKKLLIIFEDKEYTINPDSLMKCSLASFVRYASKFCAVDITTTVEDGGFIEPDAEYSYRIGDVIPFQNKEIIIMDLLKIRGKFLAYKCMCNNKEYIITNYALRNGFAHLFIRHNGVVIGYDDLWTTCGDIAAMLNNPEEGFLYKKNSNFKCLFRCPRCNRLVGYKLISYVTHTHTVSCKYCSDGISYPNKLMANLLDFLQIPFDTEVSFDWCVFPSFDDNTQRTVGQYDFVIDSMRLIIEMDGGIGHGNQVYSNSKVSEQESLYKDIMKDNLAIKHNYQVIRIDCDYDSVHRLQYCKKTITNSISHLFDLSNIDWDLLDRRCQDSYFIDAINLYRQGFSPIEISKMIKRDYTSIIKYLHRGEELGMCKYFAYVTNR